MIFIVVKVSFHTEGDFGDYGGDDNGGFHDDGGFGDFGGGDMDFGGDFWFRGCIVYGCMIVYGTIVFFSDLDVNKHIFWNASIREGVRKKNGKIVPFWQKKERQTSILEKYFFNEHVESF